MINRVAGNIIIHRKKILAAKYNLKRKIIAPIKQWWVSFNESSSNKTLKISCFNANWQMVFSVSSQVMLFISDPLFYYSQESQNVFYQRTLKIIAGQQIIVAPNTKWRNPILEVTSQQEQEFSISTFFSKFDKLQP